MQVEGGAAFEVQARRWWRDWDVPALEAAVAPCDPDALAAQPAQAHWAGLCAFMQERADSLALLELAYAGHAAAEDTPGCLMAAAAAVMICVLDVGAQREVSAWCERARRHEGFLPASADPHMTLWRHLGCICVGVLSGEDTPAMEAAARWLHDQLEPLRSALTAHDRLIAAQVLVNYHLFGQQYDRFDALRVNVEYPPLFDRAAPLMQARWLYTYGFAKYHGGEPAEAERAWRRAAALSHQHTMQVTGMVASLALLRLEVDRGALAAAAAIEAGIDDRSGAGRESQLALLHQMRARLRLLEQLPSMAKALLDQAVTTALRAGATRAECASYDADRVQVLIALGQEAEAGRMAAELAQAHHGRNSEVFRAFALLIEAWRLRADDLQGSRQALSDGLRLVQTLGLRMFFRLQPGFAANVCALALTWGIERSFVLEVIGQRQLAAPPHADQHWPWRYWEQLLGSTESRIDGQPVKSSGARMPAKPVELHRLLTCQPDLSMPLMKAAEALWPEGDRDGGDKTTAGQRRKIEENIARLRTRLGTHSAVEVSEGIVKLDRGASNSDVRCRRLLIDELRKMALRSAGLAPGAVLPGIAEATTMIVAVRSLSRGELMPGVEGVPWVDEERAQCEKDMKTFRATVNRLMLHWGRDALDGDVLA